MTSSTSLRQFVVFCAVGLVNTGAYFAVANGLHLLGGFTETASAYLAYGALVPVSFIGHRKLTFASDAAVLGEWAKFCVVQAMSLLVISVTTYSAHQGYFSGWQTFAIISIAIPALNFLTFQAWVFARKPTA
ncbi:GtrA family protein [Mesorhizobium sp. M0621]|uniref:GtrA family protein n=1 Tax=Mesorhizobium sp. M0621 TaxID=2956974 RepID=UPI003338A500